MFTILNRLRGTKAHFGKINGSILAILVYILTQNTYLSLTIGTGYIIGESFGWGKWIGGIINGNNKATTQELTDEEGINNGIHWLAQLIQKQTDNYQSYCTTALAIRGFYWAILTILPLLMFGYLPIASTLVFSLVLAVLFPISIYMSKAFGNKLHFSGIKNKWFKIDDTWSQAEVIYGFFQDLTLLTTVLSIT